MYFLMIKTIQDTGLKYLCKCRTNKDPYKYKGSGVLWRRIINKHPEYKVDTEILGRYESNTLLKEAGLYYSELYNVVNDDTWANCIPEIGDGGPTVSNRKRICNLVTGREKLIIKTDIIPDGWQLGGLAKGPRNPLITKKIVESQTGAIRSDEIKNKFKESWASGTRKPIPKIKCEKCGREIVAPNIARHYNSCLQEKL